MANYRCRFSTLFPVGSVGNVQAALSLYQVFAATLEARGDVIGFEARADAPPGGPDLWLYSDGDGDPEHVIEFALLCAGELRLPGLWGFRWAYTCDRPRLDGFGGGAQVLDLERCRSLDWLDAEHWVADRLAEPDAPRTTAEAILHPMLREQGWTEATVLGLLLAFIDAEIAEDPCTVNRLRDYLAGAADPAGDEAGEGITTAQAALEGVAAQQAGAPGTELRP